MAADLPTKGGPLAAVITLAVVGLLAVVVLAWAMTSTASAQAAVYTADAAADSAKAKNTSTILGWLAGLFTKGGG